MRAVVVLAGDLSLSPAIEQALHSADLLIAADGGADRLREFKRVPDVLVGDLDSITGDTRASLQAENVELLQFPAEKDATDAELAIFEAVRRGATAITILGGRGGRRADHEMANLLLLAHPSLRNVDVRFLTATTEARALGPGKHNLDLQPGSIVSLVPLSPSVRGVSVTGVRWPLTGRDLTPGSTYTISNEVTDPSVGVEISEGMVLLFRDLADDKDGPEDG